MVETTSNRTLDAYSSTLRMTISATAAAIRRMPPSRGRLFLLLPSKGLAPAAPALNAVAGRKPHQSMCRLLPARLRTVSCSCRGICHGPCMSPMIFPSLSVIS